MNPFVAAAVVLVGFASGVLSGMFGVGGAVLTTPGIRLAGATPIEAVGSTIPAILPGSISGAWRYRREDLIDWRVALICGLVGSTFAIVGANVAGVMNAHYLMLITAGLLLWNGAQNVLAVRADMPAAVTVGAVGEPPGPAQPAAGERTSIPLLAPIGAAAGFLAGLLGVGGGILMVPAFTGLLRMAPKRAVASSLVAVAIFSVPAMIRHAQLDHINWAYALLLVVGVVPGAQLGAHLTIAGSERRLRLLMGLFFIAIAAVYGGREAMQL